MLSQKIEKKIIDAIQAEMPENSQVQILGMWQTATAGYVKNQIEKDSDALIVVSLGTMSRNSYSEPTGSFSGAVVLKIKLERDVDGNMLLNYSTPIDNLFSEWQRTNYQSELTALDVDGFSADSFQLTSGQPPQLDFNEKSITVTWSFTISGCDNEDLTNQTNIEV